MFVTGTFQHAASIREEKYARLNQAIQAVIDAAATPLTAEDILCSLQERPLPVSITTVYNRLRRMVVQGVLVKRKNGAGSFAYTCGSKGTHKP